MHGGGIVKNYTDRHFPFFPVYLYIGGPEAGAYVPINGTYVISRLVVTDLVKFHTLPSEYGTVISGEKALGKPAG
jgi:hypothetical protein